MGEIRNAYITLVGGPRCGWEYNIRMDLREMLSVGVDLVHLAEDRDKWRAAVNTVMKIRVP
jgi:hypothetical protein